DAVSLTASAGIVVENADGTWSWSADAGNGPASRTVTITATDSDGATSAASFALNVANAPPTVAPSVSSVEVTEGSVPSLSGTSGAAGKDSVTLSASLGSIQQNADGTWLWTYQTGNGQGVPQSVTITATDADGAVSTATFTLTVDNAPPADSANTASVTVA